MSKKSYSILFAALSTMPSATYLYHISEKQDISKENNALCIGV
jgi:hypothetical protein